jgi:DNA-binding response OmpR family regulator
VKRVLIAEDEPDMAALLAHALEERLHVATERVTNGALVLDAIHRFTPDLLILDVWLPGMNGLDVFDVLRGSADGARVPVLFLTASPERARAALDHEGVRDVLTKPFQMDVLVGRVEALLALPTAA